MLNEQNFLEEIELITKIITHPAGYDVDLFGTFRIRPTDQNIWEVDWTDDNESQYKTFNTSREAAEFFVRLRVENKCGVDFETAFYKK